MSENREVIFEMVRVGNIAKVTAIDPVTGAEATLQGPISAGPSVLKKNALAKLMYLINKEKKK